VVRKGAKKVAAPVEAPKKRFLSTAEKAQEKIRNFDFTKHEGAAKTFLNLDQPRSEDQMDVDKRPASDVQLRIFYIFTKLRPEVFKNHAQPLHTLRLALKDLGCPYVHEISFLDKGKKRAECFVNEADAEKFVNVMRAAKMLDEQYNPMAPPPHKPETTQEEIRKRLIERRAFIVASTHFGPLKRAAADTLGNDMCSAVRDRATAIRTSRGTGTPPPKSNNPKPAPPHQFVNGDRKVALDYARNPAGTLFDWKECLYKKLENLPAIKLGPTKDLKAFLEPEMVNKIRIGDPSSV